MKRGLSVLIVAAALLVLAAPATTWARGISLEVAGTFVNGVFDPDYGASETVAYDAASQRLFVTNGQAITVDSISIADIENPTLVDQIDMSPYGAAPTHVEVSGGIVAVSVVADPKTDPGVVVLLDTDGEKLDIVPVGALPDSLKFTPDGEKVVVVNEGEPSDDYSIDPEGSVSIIDLATLEVVTADFTKFNNQKAKLLREGIRIYGPKVDSEGAIVGWATVAQDLEPENLTISDDSKTAWVTLQENNAIAVVNLKAGKVIKLLPLGYKPHLLRGNGLDASNKDDAINIQRWPVLGMYQPDGIASYKVGNATFLITANEGDARGYEGFSEEARVKELELGPALTRWPDLQKDENLGRLNVTTSPPAGKSVTPDGNVYDLLFSYGARSFTIWDSQGRRVSDSGDDFEQITATYLPDYFNSNQDANDSFDSRSDDKGPEPEDVVVGEVDGRTYAFITLERIGGIMIYDVSSPGRPRFSDYVNNRDFAADLEDAGDLSPEGQVFIRAEDSPTGQPLLVTANEVSGTTTIFRVVDKL